MRKIFLLITLCILSIFSFSQDIVGKWSFDYILPDSVETGENLKPILNELNEESINDDQARIRELLVKIVPEFNPNSHAID